MDYSVPYLDTKKKSEEYVDLILKLLENENLIKWYSVNVDYKHPKLECLPLGLAKHVPTLIKADSIPLLNESYMAWNVCSANKDIEYFFNNF